MSNKKVKRIVNHPKYYAHVEGKLTRIPPGSEILVTEEEATRKRSMLVDPSERTALVGGKLVKGSDSPEKMQEAFSVLQAQLDEAIQAKNDAEARAEQAEAQLKAKKAGK